MCNKNISNTSISKFISDILYLRGVRYAVISPGSRNTPLTKAFIENKNYSFCKDEILKTISKEEIDDAYKRISNWKGYSLTPLLSLNKLSKLPTSNHVIFFILYP